MEIDWSIDAAVDEQNEYVLVVGVVGNDCVPARLAVTI
jgi:hypothetical protein